jgi:CubicO group peptidase (beta-lactamase class C family)
MKLSKYFLFFALCILLSSTYTWAQHPATGLDSLLYSKKGLRARYPNLGLSIGVVRGSATAYYSLGNTQPTQGARIDSTTLFEIGSITKTFTALLLAWEQEKGSLSSEAYLEAALPTNVRLRPGLRHRVKLTAMASHQSGLPNLSNDRYIQALFDQDPVQPFHLVTRDYLFKILRETDSLQAPGTYHYNNFAFSLLGALLAQRAGLSYGDLVQQRIVKPLGLRTTGLTYHTAHIAGRFTTKGEVKPAIIANAVAPAGGLKSNAVDLVQYVRAQMIPPAGVLGRAIKRTQQPVYRDTTITMGLAWEIRQLGGHRVYQKDGDTFGNSSLIRFDPKQQVGLVILANHQDAKLVAEIGELVYQYLMSGQPL